MISNLQSQISNPGLIRLPLAKLKRAADSGTRRPGYLEACLKAGELSPDGTIVTFTLAAYQQIRNTFNPRQVFVPPAPGGPMREDVQAQILAPAAVRQERERICRACEFFDPATLRCGQCHVCGGGIDLAWKWKTRKCPLNPPKWDAL